MINNGSHTFSKEISTNYQVLSLVPLKHVQTFFIYARYLNELADKLNFSKTYKSIKC